MALTMYQLSIPALIRGLGVLTKLLDKAEAFARDNGISPDDLVNARLAPDMLTLAGQVPSERMDTPGLLTGVPDWTPRQLVERMAAHDREHARQAAEAAGAGE